MKNFQNMDTRLIIHAVLLSNNQEVLIIKRTENQSVYPGYWDIPGGTLESGELPLEGLKREVKEETNLDIGKASLFFHTANIDKSKNKLFVRLIFLATYKGSNIILNPNEHTEYQWITKETYKNFKLIGYLYDCLPQIFDKKQLLLRNIDY